MQKLKLEIFESNNSIKPISFYNLYDNSKRTGFIDFKSALGFAFAARLGALKSDRRLFLYKNDTIWYEPKEDYGWEVETQDVITVHTSSYQREGDIRYDGKTFI